MDGRMQELIACPKFKKLCSHCGRYFPADLAVCVHDMHMLVTTEWDRGGDELELWLSHSRFYGQKHCLRCHQHFKKGTTETTCPNDGSKLERCIPVEVDGPILEDRFQLKSFIGNGRMSRVYYALEVGTGAPRVVKFLRPDLTSDERTVIRYLKVAKAASELQHPNVVRTYSAEVTDNGAPYVVTQYLTGSSIRDELQKRNRFDPITALNIFIDLARGLQYAHAHKVIHTNLTPSNVYVLQKDERASGMIVDFGAAERLFRGMEWATGPDKSKAETTNVYGDPLGICPEFCTGSRANTRSDIYQLGCCLYEALNGRPPFLRDRTLATIMAHTKDKPDEFEPDINDTLKTVILECLQKNPDERFQSATELRFVLEECRKELLKTPVQSAQESVL